MFSEVAPFALGKRQQGQWTSPHIKRWPSSDDLEQNSQQNSSKEDLFSRSAFAIPTPKVVSAMKVFDLGPNDQP